MTQPTRLRLAISGTYGVGKTTTAEAVAIAAGIPRTHALTSREILADLVSGKTVQELTAMELVLLGLRRLEERIHNEAAIDGSFVSDGSVIHEWGLRRGPHAGRHQPRRRCAAAHHQDCARTALPGSASCAAPSSPRRTLFDSTRSPRSSATHELTW
jgi:hypothetical protein